MTMIKIIAPIIVVMLIGGDIPFRKHQIKDLPRILFLGDQITRGVNDPSQFGFRDHVQELLGLGKWKSVGPYSDPDYHRIYDVNHSGEDWDWAGTTRRRIKKLLAQFMDPNAKNDWALIHLGTVNIMKRGNPGGVGDLNINKFYRRILPGRNALVKIEPAKLKPLPEDKWRKVPRRAAKPFWKKIVKPSVDLEILDKKGAIDIKRDINIEGTKAAIEQIIEEITAYNANIRIVLAKIIPCRYRIKNEEIKKFNLWIEEMIRFKMKMTGKNNLFLVDMYGTFINTPLWGEKLMSNQWYPNEQGYELMAREWVSVIKYATAKKPEDVGP